MSLKTINVTARQDKPISDPAEFNSSKSPPGWTSASLAGRKMVGITEKLGDLAVDVAESSHNILLTTDACSIREVALSIFQAEASIEVEKILDEILLKSTTLVGVALACAAIGFPQLAAATTPEQVRALEEVLDRVREVSDENPPAIGDLTRGAQIAWESVVYLDEGSSAHAAARAVYSAAMTGKTAVLSHRDAVAKHCVEAANWAREAQELARTRIY